MLDLSLIYAMTMYVVTNILSDVHANNLLLLRMHTCNTLQLDWPSETDTLKINLPRDREGYNGFEYTDEKLSMRRIHWCVNTNSIFIFWCIFEQ